MKTTYFFVLLCLISMQTILSQEIELSSFGPTFDKPVNIKHAGDSRLFVVEQSGYIQILNDDGSVNTEAFLDIDARVTTVQPGGDERGLLGLAFHPDYSNNGYFYVYYINNSNDTVISRFSRSVSDPNLADEDSELILLTFDQPFSNHNGGDMAFGADGYLYISSGDGGASGDPGDRAQSLDLLLGKLLRIDVDSPSGGNNYGIPADNPFISDPNALDEIWAYGLRNPWKFSFDKDTNDIWIADVGQFTYEEINKAGPTEAGLNYGWRCYEGNNVFNTSGDCPDISTLTFPVGEYSHSDSGNFKCSITGGYVYRGSLYPNFSGLYFFADYCSNEIGTLEFNGSTWDMELSEPFSGNFWAAFGEDVSGELYISGLQTGQIYKIQDAETLSIQDNTANSFKIFPNPATSKVTIEFKNSNSGNTITVYNVLGKNVLNIIANDTKTVLNTSTLAKGIYIVKITGENGVISTKKLVLN